MKTSPRAQKLSSVIAETIPGLVEKFATPNQVGFLTVTAVEVAGDLGLVDVFFNTMGGPPDVIESLRKISPKIRFELLKTIQLRREFVLRWKKDLGRENLKKMNEVKL